MINASILLGGAVSFTIALLIHILVWRVHRPAREIRGLSLIFIIFPFLAWGLLFLLASLSSGLLPPLFSSPFNFLTVFIWHTALSGAYIMTYPPIQAGCPSLKIMLVVAGAGEEGLTSEEIYNHFSEDTLFSERFEDLVKDGLISFKYDAWGITLTGRVLARFFIAYRRLLKLPLGEG